MRNAFRLCTARELRQIHLMRRFLWLRAYRAARVWCSRHGENRHSEVNLLDVLEAIRICAIVAHVDEDKLMMLTISSAADCATDTLPEVNGTSFDDYWLELTAASLSDE
jgi:hypothetical protein